MGGVGEIMLGRGWSYNQSQNIWDKLYLSRETSHYGKSLIAIFRKFFAIINKIFIFAGRLGTSLSFYEV